MFFKWTLHFPSGSVTKILYKFLIPPIHNTRPAHYILTDVITLTIIEVYKL